MNSLLDGVDGLVTQVPGENEPTQAVLKSSSYANLLARTTAIVKMLPNLHTRRRERKRLNATPKNK